MSEAAAPSRVEQTDAPSADRDLGVRGIAADAAVDLEPWRSSALLPEGRVNLLSLDPIVERLGELWPARRALVHSHVERLLQRRLGPAGAFLRISETDVLIQQPDAGLFGAQSACLKVMDDLCDYFIGPGREHDVCVFKVASIESDRVRIARLDRKVAAEGLRREQRLAAQAAADEAAKAGVLSPDRWAPFVASSGGEVRVSCALEPIYETKGQTRIGYRLRRKVIDVASLQPIPAADVRKLSRNDILRIDMATIARGLARLNAEDASERQLALVVPVSFVTLSHATGRQLIAEAFGKAREAVVRGVICEICDIEAVPQAALQSAIALIKPFSLFVVGHLENGEPPQGLPALKTAGIQAVSMQCPEDLWSEADYGAWLRGAAAPVRRGVKSLMVYGCEGARRAAMASVLGATHISFGVA